MSVHRWVALNIIAKITLQEKVVQEETYLLCVICLSIYNIYPSLQRSPVCTSIDLVFYDIHTK